MSDPIALFAQSHIAGVYCRIPLHRADDALRAGLIPAPGKVPTLCDQYVVWFRWITCACGRGSGVKPNLAVARAPLVSFGTGPL